MSIENALREFIGASEPGAIVLQGRWGLGKTYFWRQKVVGPYLKEEGIPNDRKRYSYVSMFGIETIADLKVAIFQSADEFDSDARAFKLRFLNYRWLWWKTKKILPFALESADIPYLRGGLAKAYNALAFLSIRDRIICIDDLERRGEDLKLLDVLGLISYLAEQRRCRVVVILNSGALSESDQETWDKQKEKVFLGEMSFEPSTEECIELGLDEVRDEHWAPLAKSCLVQLGVSNIRVISRTKRVLKRTFDLVGKTQLQAETVDRLVRVLVMLEFAHSGRSEGAPPIDLVLRTGPFDYALFEFGDEGRSEQEKSWIELISSYNVFFGDELDMALAKMVRAGFPDPEEIRVAIQRFEDQAQINAYKEAWNQAWRLYHDTFDDNSAELLDAFERTWPPVSSIESANNLESLSRLLRKLGRPDLATRFIHEWVRERRGDRFEELGPDHFRMFGPVTDPELVEAMEAGFAAGRSMPDLKTAILDMGPEGKMDRDSAEVIASADPRSIAELLSTGSGRELVAAATNVMKLVDRPQDTAWAGARENMRAALKQMAEGSPLMADRIRNKFGIAIDD